VSARRSFSRVQRAPSLYELPNRAIIGDELMHVCQIEITLFIIHGRL
jgi:hypothetical protein